MALDYLTLSNKPVINIIDKNGNKQTCIDLLPKTTDAIFSKYILGVSFINLLQ